MASSPLGKAPSKTQWCQCRPTKSPSLFPVDGCVDGLGAMAIDVGVGEVAFSVCVLVCHGCGGIVNVWSKLNIVIFSSFN